MLGRTPCFSVFPEGTALKGQQVGYLGTEIIAMGFVTMQFSIALEKNENRLLNLSAIACAVFVLVATQAVQAGETEPPTYQLAPELAVGGQVQRAIGPRYYLGVSMQNVLCWIRAYGWVPGVQITALVPGSPAANSGLEVGDVIVWANNRHVQTWDQLRNVIAQSTGFLSLSVVKGRTSDYVGVGPITLAVYAYAPVAAAPTEVVEEAPAAPAKSYPSAQAPAAPAKSYPAAQAPAAPPEIYPAPPFPDEAASQIPQFPWPPPKASARITIPSERLRGQDQPISLLAVARRLESAFNEAGYGELRYYSVPKGFAIVSRLEQIKIDGTPLEEANRWSTDVAPPRVYSLASYLQALFSANSGHFRVIAFAVTSEPVTENPNAQVTREEALGWLTKGSNKLPREYGKVVFDEDYDCTVLIYEFEKPAVDDPPFLNDPSRLTAKTHLEKAKLWNELGR